MNYINGPAFTDRQLRKVSRQPNWERVGYIAASVFLLAGVFVVVVTLTVLMMELAQRA